MFPLEFRAEVNHGEEVMPEGKSFHLRPYMRQHSATGKARRLPVESLTTGTNRLSEVEYLENDPFRYS